MKMSLGNGLSKVLEGLIDVATGRVKADLVVKDVVLVNVFTGELQEGVDIAIKDGYIALVGDAGHTVGSETYIFDGRGLYAAPGFLDGHVHVESSMITFTEFAKISLLHGTTGIFADPHEITNVLGLRGLKMVLEEIRTLPMRVFLCIPSCVPASLPEFETAGAELTTKDIERAFRWPEAVALGEMMNYPGVISKDPEVLSKIKAALRAGKVIDGHSDGITGKELNAYLSAGISSCHEASKLEYVAERLRLGMYAMVREGSISKDLAECIRVVTEMNLNPRRVILVTDDRHPADLLREGYMDHVLRRAMEEGVDPVTAIQMVTINPAEHFRVDHLVGSIAPSRAADIVLISRLEEMMVDSVIVGGIVAVKNGSLKVEIKGKAYPEEARKTVRLHKLLEPRDFEIRVGDGSKRVKVHVIGVGEVDPGTRHLVEEVEVIDGLIEADPERDLALIAVIERHKATGNIGKGLVKGFGLKEGAVASTVAHDSHNMIVLGVNREDMALAANRLAEIGGGMIAVRGGRVLASVELPIAGLISDEPIEVVAEKVRKFGDAWKELGCSLTAPFMVLSSLSLSVLPELRITDKGLVDVNEFKLIDLLADQA